MMVFIVLIVMKANVLGSQLFHLLSVSGPFCGRHLGQLGRRFPVSPGGLCAVLWEGTAEAV